MTWTRIWPGSSGVDEPPEATLFGQIVFIEASLEEALDMFEARFGFRPSPRTAREGGLGELTLYFRGASEDADDFRLAPEHVKPIEYLMDRSTYCFMFDSIGGRLVRMNGRDLKPSTVC